MNIFEFLLEVGVSRPISKHNRKMNWSKEKKRYHERKKQRRK